VTSPEGDEVRVSSPELDLLKRDVEGMIRAWEHEVPMIRAVIEQGGRPYELLFVLVHEYYDRAVSYSDAIWHVLRHAIGVAFFPLMRSLYEAHVALRFLAVRPDGERLREAQIATAHSWYHPRWQIRVGRKLDVDGAELLRIEENLARIGKEITPEIMALAKKRESCFSWTGKSMSELLKEFGLESDYYGTYSPLSNMTHGHHVLISAHVLGWTLEDYERGAATARSHLRAVRRLMQDIVYLRFSDPEIDSFSPGDSMEIRYPHLRARVDRP
jgi:hypothetical protein